LCHVTVKYQKNVQNTPVIEIKLTRKSWGGAVGALLRDDKIRIFRQISVSSVPFLMLLSNISKFSPKKTTHFFTIKPAGFNQKPGFTRKIRFFDRNIICIYYNFWSGFNVFIIKNLFTGKGVSMCISCF